MSKITIDVMYELTAEAFRQGQVRKLTQVEIRDLARGYVQAVGQATYEEVEAAWDQWVRDTRSEFKPQQPAPDHELQRCLKTVRDRQVRPVKLSKLVKLRPDFRKKHADFRTWEKLRPMSTTRHDHSGDPDGRCGDWCPNWQQHQKRQALVDTKLAALPGPETGSLRRCTCFHGQIGIHRETGERFTGTGSGAVIDFNWHACPICRPADAAAEDAAAEPSSPTNDDEALSAAKEIL